MPEHNEGLPTDQRLREKVKKLTDMAHARGSQYLEDQILQLIHAQQKEAVEACVGAVEKTRCQYGYHGSQMSNTGSCRACSPLRDAIRTAAAGYLGEQSLLNHIEKQDVDPTSGSDKIK